ncbi:MAG: PilZ domain-containing protein [Phycisphaerales bacterium]|nr:PilZ domain-containing protein [Phycisphaerales bacterium]
MDERRQHHRAGVERPCKIFHRDSQQYARADTCDLSPGGAFLRVNMPRRLQSGDEIDVFIAWSQCTVLPGDAIFHARVLRALPLTNGTQGVAVEFLNQADLSALIAA